VCTDESNVQDSTFVIGLHYEPELVASNIENNAISFDKAGMLVPALDVLRA
jgi:hypothetical protein